MPPALVVVDVVVDAPVDGVVSVGAAWVGGDDGSVVGDGVVLWANAGVASANAIAKVMASRDQLVIIFPPALIHPAVFGVPFD